MTRTGIVAMANDGVIGRDGQLPWRLKADLKRFKKITWGHFLVMGRKTFESIGRPLPGRTSVVVTRQGDFSAPEAVVVVNSLERAFRACEGEEEIFVIGGAEIYRATLEDLDRLLLTRVHADVPGDAHFPALDPDAWRLVEEERREADRDNEFAYSFQLLERIRESSGSDVVHSSGF